MQVQSSVGVGTTFDMYFPATHERPAPSTPVAATCQGQGQRIMVVDDEPAVGSIVALQLKSIGYQTTLHADPCDALAALQKEPGGYSLLITDLTMPTMSGLVLIRQVHGLCPSMPCLMMSGFNAEVDEESSRADIFLILHKPFSCDDLGRAVANALRTTAGAAL
jgi:DNA-binding NtrC family response regulator